MTESNQFKPSLGLLDATLLVAGSMIGSGIFIVSADITRHVGSAGWLLVVWLLTGFMTLTAALSYGELSAMFPKAGGQYVYLKESYNPLVGFLYGWSFFSVIQTGTIAAVAVAFSKFTGTFIDVFDMTDANILFKLGVLKIYPAQLLAISTIILLTYINTKGVEGGKKIQTFFTTVKLLSLFGLIALGFAIGFSSATWQANFTNAFSMQSLTKVGDSFSGTPVVGVAMLGAMAAAMVGSIFSSDAWNNVTFIAGEVKNPSKNIGLSLLLGTLIVTCIYLLANVMYLGVLPLNDIAFAQQDRVANAASAAIFGSWGSYIIAAMIMISTFGCNNGLILAGARVYYSMAKDGLFFAKAGELNKNSVPAWALWAQAVVASLLCLSGRYGDLLDMVSCIVVLFYALTIIGIFILRKKQPNTPRPYKAFGYPVLPAIYIAMAAVFCGLLVAYKPEFTWPGLGITALGIPIYYFVKRSKH
ncbi:MAG: amino acid permease [Bacteroidetes bacterium]|nr:MAG: amino acid permease [Bacteroidota bacterium]